MCMEEKRIIQFICFAPSENYLKITKLFIVPSIVLIKLKKKNTNLLKINFFSLKDVGDFKEFNVSNTNYLRHNYSCLKSLQKSKKNFL